MKAISWILPLSFVLLSGCSVFSKKTGNEPMELQDFEETAAIRTVWSKGAGAGQGDGFTRLTPAINGDMIYSVDSKGQIFVFNKLNGKLAWSKKTKESISAGISSEHGMLLMANATGELIALSNEDGSPLWRKQVQGEILAAPRTNGEVVAVQTMNGRIYVMDAKTGNDLWFYENSPPVLTLRGTPSPIVTDNAIYAGFSNGRFMAFNPDSGSILWEQRVALPQGRSELNRMVDIHATPILQDGILYVSTYQGKVSAMARGTGSGIWSQDSSSSESIALHNNTLYLSQADGKVVAYSAATGELLWQNEQLLRRKLSGPQAVGNYLAVVDFKGIMHVLDRETGEFAARRKIDRKGVRAVMLADDGKLYVYGNGGKLMALEISAK